MKLTRGRRNIFWLIVTAYLALLAHAFIPHHHHGEQVAYLNHMSCPHDHTDTDHAAEHTQPAVDCETLKNILLNESQSSVSDLMADSWPTTDTALFPSLSHVTWGLPVGTSHFQHLPLSFTGLSLDSQDLRGPPAFS